MTAMMDNVHENEVLLNRMESMTIEWKQSKTFYKLQTPEGR
jgi:hypothetical protein